eukprot:scpid34862/ scgid32875/ 
MTSHSQTGREEWTDFPCSRHSVVRLGLPFVRVHWLPIYHESAVAKDLMPHSPVQYITPSNAHSSYEQLSHIPWPSLCQSSRWFSVAKNSVTNCNTTHLPRPPRNQHVVSHVQYCILVTERHRSPARHDKNDFCLGYILHLFDEFQLATRKVQRVTIMPFAIGH